MKTRKILLIINPVSGRMKSKTGLFEILDELYRDDRCDLPAAGEGESPAESRRSSHPSKPAGVATASLPLSFGSLSTVTIGGDPNPDRRVTVAPTMHRGHASMMAATAAEEGYDTVICCGGDGTFNETVSGLLSVPEDIRPTLGYIPAGSTNDFAASMGLSSSLRGAARTSVGEHETSLDVGLFHPRAHGGYPARYFTYIASFGAFTAASYSTSQVAKNLFGHVAYLLQGIKDLANLQSHHARFDLPDGNRIEGDYVFGAVTNTTSAGGVVKLPSDKVCLSDGIFELFLVHMPKSPADLQRIATALLAQDFDTCPLVELHHIRAAEVYLENNLSWSLDGEEAVGGTHIEIRCLPGAVRLKTND